MSEFLNFARIRMKESKKEWWFIRGRLIKYLLDVEEELAKEIEEDPARALELRPTYDFYEAGVSIEMFHMPGEIGMFYPGVIDDDNYIRIRPDDIIYFTIDSHTRVQVSQIQEKSYIDAYSQKDIMTGQILEIVTKGDLLVDTGIPIYTWGSRSTEYIPSVGDWVSIQRNFNCMMIKQDELDQYEVVAMTDDFRSWYEKK